MNKNAAYIISLFICIIMFFLGYAYAYREIELQNTSENRYINISTNSRGITVDNPYSDIILRVNNELMMSGSIDLE